MSSAAIALTGPAETPGAPAITAPAINAAVNAALLANYNAAVVASGGDASATVVTPTGGTTARTLATRYAENLTPFDLGAKGDGSSDDTSALTTWAAAGGGYLPVPPGGFYKVTSTIVITAANVRISGAGPASLIKLVLPGGAAVVPVIDLQSASTGSELDNFAVDHNSSGLIANTVYNANIIAGSAILIQADDAKFSRLTVSNAYDNGISLVKMSAGGAVTAGSPKRVQFWGNTTKNCGIGDHTGAGIDVASGSDCSGWGCNDIGSATGFIIDIGGGAQATLTGFRSWNPTSYGGNSGCGFYVGSADSSLVNCTSFFANGPEAFWFDGPAINVQAVSCAAYSPVQIGVRIKSTGPISLVGFNVKNASTGSSGSYDAFLCDNSAGSQSNIQLVGCATVGSTHRYGYNETGGNGTSAMILGGSYNGISGGIASGKASGGWYVPTAAVLFAETISGAPGTSVTLQTANGVAFTVNDPGVTAPNFLFVRSAASGNAVQFGAYTYGADAGVDLMLQPYGTGNLKFGTYTGGVVTQAGYVTIKDSGGTTRRLLVG